MPDIIAELRQDAPAIDIELVASDETENLLFREADIAVRMYRPKQLDMVARHLGDVKLALFGAKHYLDRHGRPKAAKDIMDHDIVGYDRDDTMIRGFRDAGYDVGRDFFPVRCDNQSALWELVRAGCGLGFAPMHAGANDPGLELLALDLPIPRLPIWLTAHETVRQSPRVDLVWRILAKRLAEICDPPAS